jgi:hypothetical protein
MIGFGMFIFSSQAQYTFQYFLRNHFEPLETTALNTIGSNAYP